MALANLIGQQAAVASLQTALGKDAVPQAYLFLGPDGSGKTRAAIEFAKALCCVKRQPGETDACDVCVNCQRIAADQHPDVKRLSPDGEQTKIWQFWTRSGHPPGALENLNFGPVAGPRRVYLIERAETLNEEAANSILKALEEPPPYVQWLLCAPTRNAVLPTILSRCQIVRFRPVPTDVIARALQTERTLPQGEAALLAAYAEGAPGRALRLADAPELREQRGALLDLAARIAGSPPVAAFRLAEDLRSAAKPPKVKKGDEAAAAASSSADDDKERTARGDLARALDVLAAWHHDLLAVTLGGPDAPVIHADRRDAIAKAAARYRPEQIAQNIETLMQFRGYVQRNANAQLATEVLLLRLIPRKGAEPAPATK